MSDAFMGWFILGWVIVLVCVCVTVISVAWARLTTKGIERFDNYMDRDMIHDYSQLADEQKDIIRMAVRDMRDD